MFSYPERLLAFRYMRSKRRDGFVSVITLFSVMGIMLGVATLILVTSLMNGIREEMTSNFIGLDGHVSVYGHAGGAVHNVDEVKQLLMQQAGALSAVERIEGQVMASSPRQALGAQVVGYSPKGIHSRERLISHIIDGEVGDFAAGGGVVVGKALADSLGLGVGDSITLISPQGRQTFAGFVPRIKAYSIRATFQLGMHMLDRSMIVMPFDDAATYFQVKQDDGGAATSVTLSLADASTSESTAMALTQTFGGQYRVYDYKQANNSIFTALKIQRDVMVVILALIILVAIFNIISSLIMLVQDKARDIAILRTMGASRAMVRNIFLIAGMMIGIIGTFLGLLLGLFAAYNIEGIRKGLETLMGQELLVGSIYFLSSLPTKVEFSEVVIIVAFSLLLSFISTLYPSIKAASQEPAEALRYE
jgi:lipoprotein-releasing system permease protein